MEEQGSPTGGVVNMTRAMEALAPLLDHPRRRIIQVEALVTVATSLLFLQLVLGFCKRRRWLTSIVKGVLSLSNAVMFPLILYALGLMQSSPIKNSVYPVLAVSLLLAAVGTNIVKQYDFHDKKKMPQYVFEIARYAFYLSMLVTLVDRATFKQSWGLEHQDLSHSRRSPSSTCFIFLFVVSYFSKGLELELGFIFRDRHNGKIIEKWMKKKVDEANDHQNDSDQSLKGYNYLVNNVGASIGNIITVDKIWDFCSNSDNGKALKDVCLSLALFELLKRRYYGLVCAEARLPETQDSFFKCLLPTENDYERAFRIVEMELGFCYNFFFTKYYSIYVEGTSYPIMMLFLFLVLLTRISLICAVVVYTLQSSLVLETLDPIIEVHSTRADYIIALVVLGTVLIVELLQATFYLASDWFKVSLACWYVTVPCRCKANQFIFDEVICLLRRITISVGRRNRIGQYSVISDFTDYYMKENRNFWDRMVLLLEEKPAKEVSDTMKYIARSLISTQGNLTNGETSLRLNLKEMFEQYCWTLEYHSEVEFMLMWHIATEYCDLGLSIDGRSRINQDDWDAAVKLSRYFAYLIYSIPELLPYHAAGIRELKSIMMKEVRENLASSAISERYETMKKLAGTGQEDNPTTTFLKGVTLGKQLELMQDGDHWKVLAGFWAEAIIYIAPSHMTAKQHMENLENGGEFLTHIWAMLSHCGILACCSIHARNCVIQDNILASVHTPQVP
jgi:hypothetical protein